MSQPSRHEASFWIQKLAAFLHDPPSTQSGLTDHESSLEVYLRHIGVSNADTGNWNQEADWWASAADQYPFPSASELSVDWQKEGGLQFHHPLSGTRFAPSTQARKDSTVSEEWIEDALHGLSLENAGERERYFRVWRFLAERAAREKHDLMAYLVADSRLPDHTLWQHNAVASAMTGTKGKCSFLMFQIGPVQDFIAQSRKMQDLWSGSYLLSFLISKALSVIALKVGPDAIIYPNLKAVPLLDWWWSQENGLFPEGTFRMGSGRLHAGELLIPSLPNRFLALVPTDQAHELAKLAEQAIKDLWKKIADSVHQDISEKLEQVSAGGAFSDWNNTWEDQTARFPSFDVAIHDWDEPSRALQLAQHHNTPPLTTDWGNHSVRHAEIWRSKIGDTKHATLNPGTLWPLHYEMADWKFAAAKRARGFKVWPGTFAAEKDNLNGRDEVIGGADAASFWQALRNAYRGEERGDFKGSQKYGALSVIKRLWARCFLHGQLNWSKFRPSFDSVQDIARGIDAESDDEIGQANYYAVLCMDGDDMGQWLSGARTLPVMTGMADKAARFFAENWPKQQGDLPAASDVKRPVSPSYHAALSEALNNFSLYAANTIVEAFEGQLFYAGGDDVLAILPAKNALDCAEALKCAYQGKVPSDANPELVDRIGKFFEFPVEGGGFIRCIKSASQRGSHRPNWPLMVMGPKATISVGIAIGHVRLPMQDMIQAAREAESSAKRVKNKGAYCMRVIKRSGESSEFAARFESGVRGVWQELGSTAHERSNRFAYRYVQLIKPLLSNPGATTSNQWEPVWNSELVKACEAELAHVLTRQAEQSTQLARENAARWITSLIGTDLTNPALSPIGFIHFWMSWAFINRLPNER